MKKTILAVLISIAAVSLGAAELVEAIVVRVGDRVVTRTQYVKRLREGYAENASIRSRTSLRRWPVPQRLLNATRCGRPRP